MSTGVLAVLERTVVTSGYFALFAVVLLSGKMTTSIEVGMVGGLGAVLMSWFGGHLSSNSTTNTAAQTAAIVTETLNQVAANQQAK